MKVILFLFLSVNSLVLFSQNEFQPGYYIIKENAQYIVLQPSGADFIYSVESDCYSTSNNYQMNANEVVVAYAKNKENIYCYDPNGRIVVFKSINSLVKAPTPGNVCFMKDDMDVMSGSSIIKGSFVWGVGQNTATESVIIMYADGSKIDVPQHKLIFFEKFLNQFVKENVEFSTVVSQ